MKNNCLAHHIISLLILWLCSHILPVNAYNLRQFSNKNGLSNSAILSLYQDEKGVIWIGSCDGLNIYDGNSIYLYHTINTTNTLLSGNLINQITGAEENILWIQTNYGLDRLDTQQQTSQTFADFKDNNFMVNSNNNTFFILKDDGHLYYYQASRQAFQQLNIPAVDFSQVLSMIIDTNDVLWIFCTNNDTRSYSIIKKGKDTIELKAEKLFKHTNMLRWAFAEKETAYFIDDTYGFYEYDFANRQSYYIADLTDEIKARGEVSSVIKQQNDYYIGFKNSGLIVLKHMPDQKIKYQIQPTEIHTGIFCLMKDRFQDIVWIGTDGQGMYMYSNSEYSIINNRLDNPVYQVNNPVRTLYYDQKQTLWIGTKGGGMLRIPNYRPDGSPATTAFERINTGNSSLTDNSVYCLAPGNNGILWIGTENGLNYYSYRDRNIRELRIHADGKRVKYIHAINQLNDTTLWISTVGEGIVKAILNPTTNGIPSVKHATRIVMDNGRMAANYFFTSFQENDSILWFGNRGYGAYRMNVLTEQLTPYRFDDIVNSQTVNDIFAIYKNQKGYWLGTSSGLLHTDNRYTNATLMSANTVHGILEDYRGNLWISTNQGLIRFNQKTHTSQSYTYDNGLDINEFSDGAFYKDPQTGNLFFGGINGFVVIKPNSYIAEEYMPQINLKGISVFGKECNLHDFLHYRKGQPTLQLDYKQNFFQLTFMAVDYINGNNYSYSYKLEGASDNWIENGTSPNASFSNLAPGEYTLLVKYRNNSNGKESLPEKFIIRINPPWYLCLWAYIGYFSLFVLLCANTAYKFVRKYRRRQRRLMEEMDRQKKEEIYESKLRFFTNITHEFCTPLTLIYGPCEKIIAYTGSDSYVQKYARMIRQNAEKLNGLILELLEFRRLETGHKVLSIQPQPLSETTENIAESFAEMAENRQMDYRTNIAPGISWNTDLSCFNKIVANLLSNAFKYTPDGGTISITLREETDHVLLRIANTGKGIAKEDIGSIFDRYKILDTVEMNGKNARNGLGLAICKSMTTLLKGEISVESIPGQTTTFTVSLPRLDAEAPTAGTPLTAYEATSLPQTADEPATPPDKTTQTYDATRKTIMVIDDDPSMLWFVSEIFTDKYNVLSYNNAREALDSLEQRQPDIIVSDVMMPGIDGLSFARKVKENKLWKHIPLVLLSALHHEDDQVKGIESGAEAYITKPFNTKYLERIVSRLISREAELKDYYSSAFSAFTVENGHCLHKEDQDFLDRMLEIIETNIANPDLQVEFLSSEMNYSTRQFYRKLKQITDKSPADIIKECRLTMAERLLVVKNLTIEEIMDQTGFTNRSTFYKAFSQRYSMPPRQYREQQKDTVKKERNDTPTAN